MIRPHVQAEIDATRTAMARLRLVAQRVAPSPVPNRGGAVTADQLIELARAFASHRGLSLSTVSTYAANDGKFFGRLANGSGCTVKRAATLLTWFDHNWDRDLAWPESVPRPSTKTEDAA